MDKAAIIWMLCMFVFAQYLALRNCVHMLQLNSYQFPGYFRTVLNPERLTRYVIALVLFGMLFLMNELFISYFAYIAYGTIFMILGFCNLPKPAKKKLIFTTRVRRLFATSAMLCVALIVTCLILNNSKLMCICMSAHYVLTIFVVLIASIINYPIEKLIQQMYINDAKHKLRDMNNLLVISITGSFGKTSVKNYLASLLSNHYNVLMTPESFNTPMGITRSIREHLRPIHEVFICEMGARHIGDIAEDCAIVTPNWGIITAIGEQHLETFKTLNAIKQTKLELAQAVIKNGNGKLFINGDSVTDAKQLYPTCITYGLNKQHDCYADNVECDEYGMSFTYHGNDGVNKRFTTGLIGEHNAINIVGAIAVACAMGVNPQVLSMRVRRLKTVEHRLELRKSGRDIIIDDSYNSNPAGCKAALKAMNAFCGVKILITPGMVELGRMQDDCNRKFGEDAAKVCDYVFLVGRSQTVPIMQGLKNAGFDNTRIIVCNTFKEAMSNANQLNIHDSARRIILIENDLPDNY